jgi:uncharacterized protein
MSINVYRKQIEQIIKDLNKKIVFLVGPRQVGKTWLAKQIAKQFSNSVYLNYDSLEDRDIIKKEQWLETTNLIIFDELHKMKGWKNYLKGVYDTKPDTLKILVTGSARLETFKKGGDSLAGRFFIHHLLPFSLSELMGSKAEKGIDYFLERGGFPEPFLARNNTEANRWRSLYADSLIRTDVLNFERIQDFKAITDIFELLRRRVGSPVSYSSLARDVEVSSATVKKYVQILEALYVVFIVKPYSKKISRAILKEPKIYFFDNGLVFGNEGVKLENFSAVSLLKNALLRNDYFGENNSLKYLRTKDEKEADFALVNGLNEIEKIIEIKNSDNIVSKNLKYFSEKYNLQAEQIVKNLKREKQIGNIKILNAGKYFQNLAVR